MLALNILALQLCGIASLGVYCASRHQVLLPRALSRGLALGGFLLSIVVAQLLLNELFHWLAASLIIVSAIMLCWVVLALSGPYVKAHPVKTLIGYFAGLLLISLLGPWG